MKKKLTSLIALLTLCISGAWAQSSPVTAFTDINVDRLYTISAAGNRGNWMYGPADPLFVSSSYKLGYAPASDDTKQQWAFWENDGSFYLYNIEAERFATAQYGYWWTGSYLTFTPFPITPVDAIEASTYGDSNYPIIVRFGGTQLQTFGISNGQTHAVYRYQPASDQGNATRIIDVADFTSTQKARMNEVITGSLPIVSSGTTIKYYNIWNMRSDKIVSYSLDGTQLDQTDANNEYSAFYFRAVDDGYYIYSATNGLPLKDVSSGSVTFGTSKDDATKYYITSNTQSFSVNWATPSVAGYNISASSTASDYQAWNDANQTSVTKYSGNDGGSIWRFSTALNSTNNLTTKREEVKYHIDNYNLFGATIEAKNTLEGVYNEIFSSVQDLDDALDTFLASCVKNVYRIKSMNSGYSNNAYIYSDSYDEKHPISYGNNTFATPYWSASSADEVKDFSYFYLTTTEGFRYNASVVEPGTYKILQVYNDEPLIYEANATVTLIEGQTDQFNIKIGANSIHAQQYGAQLVFWNSSDNQADNASAWTFEAVDESSIDLDLIKARAKVRSIYKFLNNHTFGDALGEYHSGSRDAAQVISDKDAISEALNDPDATRTTLNTELASINISLDSNTDLFEYLNTVFAPYVTETAINVPSDGQFIYMKSVNNSRYVQAVTSGQLAMSSGEPAIDNIFTYTDGKLVSYSKGLYIQNTRDMAAVGATDNLSFTFEEATVIGKYEIQGASSNYMYGYPTGNEKEDKLDRITGNGNKNKDACRWTLEEVTSLPVTISSVGYATLYAPVALTIPSGVTAYKAEDKGATLSLTAIEGGVIPAGEGVILEGSAGSYDFAITTTETTISGNALTGTVVAIARPTGSYILSTSGGTNVGFYADGSQTIPGFKAYLPASTGGNVKTFVFGDDATGINDLNDIKDSKNIIYNVAGQRMSKMQKGINIVNGKKVAVK